MLFFNKENIRQNPFDPSQKTSIAMNFGASTDSGSMGAGVKIGLCLFFCLVFSQWRCHLEHMAGHPT